jgi:D-proline reductase (dithiol) PrdB
LIPERTAIRIAQPPADWADSYARFRANSAKVHDYFEFTSNHPVAFTPLARPIRESTVALVSTSGVHLRTQKLFDEKKHAGDWSYRVIPSQTPSSELVITHGHYEHSAADGDPNVVFPIDRLRELVAEGVVGALAPNHYGLSGFIPESHHLVEETGPELGRRLREEKVDAVVLTPG